MSHDNNKVYNQLHHIPLHATAVETCDRLYTILNQLNVSSQMKSRALIYEPGKHVFMQQAA